MASFTAIQQLYIVRDQSFLEKQAYLRKRRRKKMPLLNTVAKISQGILLFLLTHSIIKFFQSRDSEEVLHVHSILNK